MTYTLEVEYEFFPVGQGLFSAGSLQGANDNQPRFRWVYDCGTLRAQYLVSSALNDFVSRIKGTGNSKPRLDLVTLSHLDWDHISGMQKLLSSCSVETLMLPYLPLWQRLYIGFIEESRRVESGPIDFFVNPVAYLLSLPGVSIDRIIFVMGGSNQPPQLSDGGPLFPRDGPWEIDIYKPPAPDGQDDPDFTADSSAFGQTVSNPNTTVMFLPSGSTLHVNGCWEFVPYNDAELMPDPDDTFRVAVAQHRDALLTNPSTTTLQQLKQVYDARYKTSLKRNLISLFLYSGPYPADAPLHSTWSQVPAGCTPTGARHGIIYTGDGYLDSQTRQRHLWDHLGDERIGHNLCLQVMHHGAKGNWQPGLAQRFSPELSVFSSDPQRGYKHPHKDVKQDFMSHGLVQVDDHNAAIIHGSITYPGHHPVLT